MKLSTAPIVCGLAITSITRADVLYEQLPCDFCLGVEADTSSNYDSSRYADGFFLSAAANIESIEFWGGYLDSGGFLGSPPEPDSFTINIWEDVNSTPNAPFLPSTLVHTTTLNNLVRTYVGGFFDIHHYSADFDSVFSALSGADSNYWIEISNATPVGGVTEGWVWGFSEDGDTGFAGLGPGQFDAWSRRSSTHDNLAFRLNGTVPAPATLALLGLAGMTTSRRRR
jgi:hypothetical protein